MEEILYYIAYILETVFETYVIARLMGMFLEYTPEKKKYILGAYLVRIILCLLQYMVYPQVVVNFTMSVSTLFLITVFYEGRITKKMTVTVLVSMCMMTAELMATIFLILTGKFVSMQIKGYNGDIFTIVLIAISFWIISEIVHMFRNIHRNSVVPKTFSVYIIVAGFFMYVLQFAIFFGDALSETVKILSVMCYLVIMFMIIYLYDTLARNYTERLQAELIKREKNYYCKQAELLKESSEELSAFRHDSMNHLYALSSMLNSSNDEAMQYMEKLIGKMQETNEYCKTGNIAVDSVVNYKLGIAEQNGINIVSQIAFPEDFDSAEEDLVGILGNLLDNAIEASEKITEGRYIYFDMKYKSGVVFICVKNRYDGKRIIQNGTIKTRKQDMKYHGIGLKSVKSTVESYGGNLDIQYDDKEFGVKIMMYV